MNSEAAKTKQRKQASADQFSNLTLAQVARMAGCDSSVVTRWKHSGCPTNRDGTMDAPAVIAWLRSRDREDSKARAGRARKGDGDNLDRYRLERARLARIDRLEREGALVPLDEARAVLTEEITGAKRALLGLGRKLAPLVAGMSPAEAEAEIGDEITAILRRISQRRDKMSARKETTDVEPTPSRVRKPARRRARRVERA